MKMKVLIGILVSGIALQLSATDQNCVTSPFKDLRGKPRHENQQAIQLDQSIASFLTKEGLLNPEGKHPFESETKDYRTLFGDKETERVLREIDKRNAYHQARTEHLKDVKSVRRANKLLEHEKYRIKPILVSN